MPQKCSVPIKQGKGQGHMERNFWLSEKKLPKFVAVHG